jgi:hypothetical protein
MPGFAGRNLQYHQNSQCEAQTMKSAHALASVHLILLFGLVSNSHAQTAAPAPTGLWQQLAQAPFDPEKAASLENVTIVRDRIRILLTAGTVQFSQPAQGLVYGAAFRGKGRIEVQPPTAIEARQLRLFTGQESLGMDFTEATFTFSDGTFEEIGRQVHWRQAPDKSLWELYLHRQEDRESVGAEVVPRLFKSILSGDQKRTALFIADMKTNEKGWIQAVFDALEAEEVFTGRWAYWDTTMQFDSWLSFPAGNRSAADAFSDPLAKEDFDIKKYRIDARVTAGAELSAITQMNLVFKAAGEKVLLFQLDSNLRVVSVKDGEGQPLGYFQSRDSKGRVQSSGDYVAVILPSPSASGASQTIEFAYSGKGVVQRVGPGNYFCQSSGWYPSRPDNFAARADFEMTFRCPKRSTVVATGSRVGASVDGEWAVTQWKSSIPLAVAGFAFGDYKLYATKVGHIAVEAYANAEPDDNMRQILSVAGGAPVGSLSPAAMIKTMGDELGNMLRVFESYFGPYPYDRLAVTNIPYSYGQGWPTLIYLSALSFMDSTQRNAFRITQNIQLTDFFRAHETSHQWWGHRVGWKSYHDQWLSEGFAQFSGNLYVQYRQNEKEYVTRLKQDKEQILSRDKKDRVYESVGPLWMGTRLASSDAPDDYAKLVYNKGGLVLNMLRRLLWNPQSSNGDERFIALMKDYGQTYNNQAASTEDFKALVEKHMLPAMDLEGNRRMDWFFRQYVYGTGIPEYQIQYQSADAGGGKWKMTCKIVQSGVPAGWLDVLPFYAQTQGKVMRLGVIGVKGTETPFEFTMSFKPEKLILNHLEDTLAIIR